MKSKPMIIDLPEELREVALKRQEEQGNKRNPYLPLHHNRGMGNFTWGGTPEGHQFWEAVYNGNECVKKNPLYPKKPQDSYPVF